MYFFCNKDISISSQTVAQAFGPVNSNQFNCTSKFTINGSGVKKALAVQTGVLIAQEDSSGRINIALRPLNNQSNKPSVFAYIYRGLDKSNFLDSSNNIISSGNTNETDFTASIWSAYQAYNGNTNGPVSGALIGFDNTAAGSISLASIFNNQEAITAHVVQEGAFIGNWNSSQDIGFEVVLMNDFFLPDIDFLRKTNHTIDVSSLTNLELKAKREEVLAFIDPAAFYGLHYYDTVSAIDSNGNTSTYKEQSEYYDDILNIFQTKNRVYLDIRNESGYSYNFYGNYQDGSGNHVKLGNSLTAPTAQVYSTSSWPYLAIDTAPSITGKSDFQLCLRLSDTTNADNTEPLVFYKAPSGSTDQDEQKWHTVNDNTLTDSGNNSDWTEPITIEFPSYNDNGVNKNIPWHICLHYVRQTPYIGSNTKVPKVESADSQYFGPLNTSSMSNSSGNRRKVVSASPRLVYGQVPQSNNNYSFIGFNEFYWDDNHVVFFLRPEYTLTNSQQLVNTVAITDLYEVDMPHFNSATELLAPAFYNSQHEVSEAGSNISVDIVRNIVQETGSLSEENVQLLCLTRTEFDEIINRSGLSNAHFSYIVLHNKTQLSSSPNIYSATVEMVGLDSNGNYASASSTSTIKIYYEN